VSCLHDIAKMGITVVAVLHQPRYEILSLCDDLLLLGKGDLSILFVNSVFFLTKNSQEERRLIWDLLRKPSRILKILDMIALVT
jgi:hypothetical protein